MAIFIASGERVMKDKDPTLEFDDTGPSSSQTPYVVPTMDGVQLVSLLSTGDHVGLKPDGTPWRMVGIPDGLGAFDNGDGTMTVLMNHELGATTGVVREHGSTGAFVSKLIIDKETLEVLHAEDLSKDVFLFDRTTDTYVEGTTQYGRLCSADLAPVSAFFDATTGLGTTERIFMDGEEVGNLGRAFAHIVTGTEAGDSYELPRLGQMSWENALANPASGVKTVVICLDDSTPGEVYLYVGDKQATGTAVEKAGLTNGLLYGIAASFGEDKGVTPPGGTPPSGTFTLVAQGNNGDVSHIDGSILQNQNDPLTQFGRPEDGHWDPSNPNRFYFVTTGATVDGVQIPTRLWAMDFIDVEHPELGGTIKVMLEGGVTNSLDQTIPVMMDNMTVTESGLVILQEDVGNNPRLGKIWMFDPKTGEVTELAHHDADRFGVLGAPAPGGVFNQDEESSGVFDVTDMLGNGEKLALLLDTQAHYAFAGAEFVEGGQLQLMYVDLPNPGDTAFSGTNGSDTFDGGFGDDKLGGGIGDDTLYGNYGDDRIDGGSGNDTLDAGPGVDSVKGGEGNDLIVGGTGNDELKGDNDNDTIDGGVGDDELNGGQGDDELKGGFGNDHLDGGPGNDVLEGNQGSDDLSGGAGNDRINGGGGDDGMAGGMGQDAFVFGPDFGNDVILDFAAGPALGDVIEIDHTIFDTPQDVLNASVDTVSGVLITVDADNSILLENVTKASLSQNDFMFV
jgi:RTX calcium-binding nonapeptide repeat (4 copies)